MYRQNSMSSWNKLQEPKALPSSTKLQFVLPLIPSLPPLVVTCLWLILDCSQKVPLVNDANKRHSLALLISPVWPHCLLNNRSYFLQMTISMYSTLEDDRTISRLGNESFIISTTFILFCAIPAFLEARQLDNVQKSCRHINPGSATYDYGPDNQCSFWFSVLRKI